LYVGSIFNRRHLPDLIRAFASLAQRHPRITLDLVGENRTHPHEDLGYVVKSEGIEHRVHWRPYVNDDELQALYRSAGAFAFLSEYEGLGLTPLEALAAGVPPLLLETPVARESCQDAALYVKTSTVSDVADGLRRLLFDQALRSRLLAAASSVLARYDRARAAARTLSVLEACAGRRR
jgi:glycosyltransferase involved in cell wall biosynthesis